MAKRGRPVSTAPVKEDDGIDVEQIEKDMKASDELAVIERGITEDQFRFTEQLGMIRMSSLNRKFLDLINIKLLIEWKESKIYKGLRILSPDNTLITINNFEDLCSAIGFSRFTVYEWIESYQALGEDFLREADAVGVGVRDLRRLRKLPADDIEAAKEILKTDGKDGLIDFVEDLCAKQAGEKQKLEKHIAGLEADAESHGKLLEKKNQKIDELHKKLIKRDRTKDWHPRALEICLETTEVGARILEAIDRLDILRDSILTEDFGEDREAAIEAMACNYWDIIHQSLEGINDLAHDCNEVFMGYKEKARPLIDMMDVFGPYPADDNSKQ